MSEDTTAPRHELVLDTDVWFDAALMRKLQQCPHVAVWGTAINVYEMVTTAARSDDDFRKWAGRVRLLDEVSEEPVVPLPEDLLRVWCGAAVHPHSLPALNVLCAAVTQASSRDDLLEALDSMGFIDPGTGAVRSGTELSAYRDDSERLVLSLTKRMVAEATEQSRTDDLNDGAFLDRLRRRVVAAAVKRAGLDAQDEATLVRAGSLLGVLADCWIGYVVRLVLGGESPDNKGHDYNDLHMAVPAGEEGWHLISNDKGLRRSAETGGVPCGPGRKIMNGHEAEEWLGRLYADGESGKRYAKHH